MRQGLERSVNTGKDLQHKEKTTILSRANSMENILKNIKSGEKNFSI